MAADYCFRFDELESKSFDAIDELTQRVSQAEAASSGGENSNRVPPAALRQLVWRYHKGEREHKDTKASTCADT